MSTIRSKAPTFHLEHEKLKELKEERVALKKGRGCLFPFFVERRSSRLHSLDGIDQDGFSRWRTDEKTVPPKVLGMRRDSS